MIHNYVHWRRDRIGSHGSVAPNLYLLRSSIVNDSRQRRCGFTVVELLVSIGIIAMLTGVLVPAVMRGREAARRIQCSTRLAELGKASHAYHDSFQSLPPARYYSWTPAPYPMMFSPFTHMLPYLDQADLWKSVNRKEDGAIYPVPIYSFYNKHLLQVTVPVFQCPSETWRGGSCNYRVCLGSDYTDQRGRKMAGCFWSSLRTGKGGQFAAISDGLSNTVLCSEKLTGDFDPSSFTPYRDAYFVSPLSSSVDVDSFVNYCSGGFSSTMPDHSYSGQSWVFNGYNLTAYNHVLPPNPKLPDCSHGHFSTGGSSNGIHSARSWHTSGVNVVMADGAARFVSESINLNVWRSLGTRAGTEATITW